MIAVVGATGNTGRAVVKELQALGETPVCIVRNGDKAREVLGANAKTAVAELTDKGALEKALQGVTRVFVVTGHNPAMVEQQGNVMEAAEKAGAKYLVRVSGGPAVARKDSPSVVGRGHFALDQALMNSSKLGGVILRPGLFMQNIFAQIPLIKEGKMVLPFPKDKPMALIDVRDTGALGARVVRDAAQHAGKTYEFSGKTTTYGEFADVFSQVLGKPITYVTTTVQQLEQTLKGRNMPDWLVTHMVMVGHIGIDGGFSNENMQPIRDIVGREPITTRKFVEDHKAMFM
jgi:uncharacterized protein YbjT (DUF2867 family)